MTLDTEAGVLIKILVADPDARQAQQLGRQLRLLGHDASLADDFESTLELAGSRSPRTIIAYVGLCPGGAPQLMQALDAVNMDVAVLLTADHPTAELTLEAMRENAIDLVHRPVQQAVLMLALQRVANLERIKKRTEDAALADMRAGISREHMVTFMIGLANVIDAKSKYTREHSDRVAQRAKVFARYLNLPDEEVKLIAFGAKLHDIGKIAVPDAILNSPNALSAEEREIMQRHPTSGAHMLKPVHVLQDIIPIVERHHENYDGSGYPGRLRGEQIPFAARLVKVVDYYDAITSKRPYRAPMSDEEACKLLLSEAGRQLDPGLTEQFVQMVSSGLLVLNNVSAVIPAEYRFAFR